MNPLSLPLRFLQGFWQFYRYAVIESVGIVRRQGWRELARQRGWKFFAGIVAYYLVRDILIYVLVPLGIARGLF